MTTKAAFTAEQWNALCAVPASLSAAVNSVDPSGLPGGLKEAAAGTRGMFEQLKGMLRSRAGRTAARRPERLRYV